MSQGGFAYLEGDRTGPTLWWNGIRVRFTMNRPGWSWMAVEKPERFGGTPRTWGEFQAFARDYATAGGLMRRRHPRSRAQRRTLDVESSRRRRQARTQKRDRYGRFG